MWEFMGEALNPKKVTVGWKSRGSAWVGKEGKKACPRATLPLSVLASGAFPESSPAPLPPHNPTPTKSTNPRCTYTLNSHHHPFLNKKVVRLAAAKQDGK